MEEMTASPHNALAHASFFIATSRWHTSYCYGKNETQSGLQHSQARRQRRNRWRRVVINGPRSTTPPSRGWQSMHCIGAIKNYVRAIEGHRCTKIYEIYLYFNEINLSHYLAPLERDILLLAWGCSSFDSSRSHNLPVCVVCPLFFRP